MKKSMFSQFKIFRKFSFLRDLSYSLDPDLVFLSNEIIRRTKGEYEEFLKDYEETTNFCQDSMEKSHPEVNSDNNYQSDSEAGTSSRNLETPSLCSPKIMRANICQTSNEENFHVKKNTRKTRSQRKSLTK